MPADDPADTRADPRPNTPLPPKTRALRKYEAEALVLAQDPGPPAIDFLSPFGPLIARTRLSDALIDHVNRYADATNPPATGSEFLVPDHVAAEGGEAGLARQLAGAVARYVAASERVPARRVRLDRTWIVSQYEGTPSPVHFHSGDVSGVLYLRVPEVRDEAAEAAKTYISGRQAGYINFIAGGKQRFARSLISFRPEVGALYVFPGWLLHGAEPFRGAGERRSLAFNAFVAEEG